MRLADAGVVLCPVFEVPALELIALVNRVLDLVGHIGNGLILQRGELDILHVVQHEVKRDGVDGNLLPLGSERHIGRDGRVKIEQGVVRVIPALEFVAVPCWILGLSDGLTIDHLFGLIFSTLNAIVKGDRPELIPLDIDVAVTRDSARDGRGAVLVEILTDNHIALVRGEVGVLSHILRHVLEVLPIRNNARGKGFVRRLGQEVIEADGGVLLPLGIEIEVVSNRRVEVVRALQGALGVPVDERIVREGGIFRFGIRLAIGHLDRTPNVRVIYTIIGSRAIERDDRVLVPAGVERAVLSDGCVEVELLRAPLVGIPRAKGVVVSFRRLRLGNRAVVLNLNRLGLFVIAIVKRDGGIHDPLSIEGQIRVDRGSKVVRRFKRRILIPAGNTVTLISRLVRGRHGLTGLDGRGEVFDPRCITKIEGNLILTLHPTGIERYVISYISAELILYRAFFVGIPAREQISFASRPRLLVENRVTQRNLYRRVFRSRYVIVKCYAEEVPKVNKNISLISQGIRQSTKLDIWR